MRDTIDTAVITTYAGTGAPGHSGDGGPADRAQIFQPYALSFSPDGALIFAESGMPLLGVSGGDFIRRIGPRGGPITTLAGSGRKGYGGDGGSALKADFNDSVCCVVEPKSGDLYIVDRLNSRIRRIDSRTGIITTVLGTGVKGFSGDGGPGNLAQIKEPHDTVIDGRGGLLIDDIGDRRIRRLDLSTGFVTTFAGDGRNVHTGDGGPVSAASFAGPRALAMDPVNGLLYVCEREGATIRRVDLRSGIITLYAGTGKAGYTGDGGPALAATFRGPKGMACGRDGALFICDTENHAIRRIDPKNGVIVTVAGGHKGPDGDGGPAVKAGLNRPHGAAVGADGFLYVSDSENNRIRRVPLAPA